MKLTVLSPVRHDHKHYAKGDTLELSEVQAQSLLDAGVVEAQKAAEATSPVDPEADSTVEHVQVGEDDFTKTTYASGAVRYAKNGETVKKAVFEAAQKAAEASEEPKTDEDTTEDSKTPEKDEE